ncbi:efflux RND transporter periplasmic adaptor subunit [Deminuibacter soli]|uniref:Efflux RND transporter periplasmic adaptor subunit n=1 Tax=Deminuibacter soli TaxID=2291815 RepID=A0A3E1NLM9_9BACT|nr:efflux RND transporter periplasmic adaptor subunit [Deminuibacter soli]RFM28823.1 efflux RND transporter periplasmic adaptor subunit [Deminuibacter soli]
MNNVFSQASLHKQTGPLIALLFAITLYSCTTSAGGEQGQQAPPPPALPVLSLTPTQATTFQEFSATIEGKVNVDIRPQVDGYLDKIYVEEGAYVTQGQSLFKINDRPYSEQVNNAQANIQAAKANMEKAAIEVNRLQPLVQNNVISDVQLKAAQAAYDAAKAQVNQATAASNNAGINLGYTLVKAPVSGYIGRIPFKTGSLVGRGEAQPLTVLSDIKEVYAYFSMSESDFLQFTNNAPGKTVTEKLRSLPPVELQLADKSIYAAKGKIELVEGQFDKTMGTISFRATFPNEGGILRSGNTGKVRIPRTSGGSTVAVPQTATYELQDKVYVFVVGDSNKVASKPLTITGHTTAYYLVDKGLQPGTKIVFAGMDRLTDGAVIVPQPMSADSLRTALPL